LNYLVSKLVDEYILEHGGVRYGIPPHCCSLRGHQDQRVW
jgi:hypothetical protein